MMGRETLSLYKAGHHDGIVGVLFRPSARLQCFDGAG
jgi:hypothetical protein